MFIYVIQIVCLLAFGAVAYVAWRRHDLWIYILATVYAAFFENIDVFLSRGQIGSYYYDEHLFLSVVKTPLFVILSWGIIFYSAWILGRGLTNKFWLQVASVPFLATIIDFAMDPVASKMGLWTWIGYGLEDGILGVPFANYIGWYFVIMAFMICLRFVRHIDFMGNFGKYIIIPPFSFAVFFILFSAFNSIATITGITMENQANYFVALFVVAGLVSLLGWIKYPGKAKIKKPRYLTLLFARIIFYLYSVYGMIIYGFWQEPVFIALLVSALAVEVFANVKFYLNAKT